MFANFKILSANIRGAGPASLDKLYSLKRDILNNKINLAFLSESQIQEANETLFEVFPPQKFQLYLSPAASNQGALTVITRCSRYSVDVCDFSCDKTNIHAITINDLSTQQSLKTVGVYASPSHDYSNKIFEVLENFQPDCTFGDYNAYLEGDSRSTRDRKILDFVQTTDFNSISSHTTIRNQTRSIGPDHCLANFLSPFFGRIQVDKFSKYSDHWSLLLSFNTQPERDHGAKKSPTTKFRYDLIQEKEINEKFENMTNFKLEECYKIWQTFLNKIAVVIRPDQATKSNPLDFSTREELEDFTVNLASNADSSLGEVFKFINQLEDNSKALQELNSNTKKLHLSTVPLTSQISNWQKYKSIVTTIPTAELSASKIKIHKRIKRWYEKQVRK